MPPEKAHAVVMATFLALCVLAIEMGVVAWLLNKVEGVEGVSSEIRRLTSRIDMLEAKCVD